MNFKYIDYNVKLIYTFILHIMYEFYNGVIALKYLILLQRYILVIETIPVQNP